MTTATASGKGLGYTLGAFRWIARGLVFALAGFAIGAGILAAIRVSLGNAPWDTEQSITFGYLFALPAWLAGVGAWERWFKEWLGKPVPEEQPGDWRRFFAFTLDHKVIGVQYLTTFVALFLIAGLLAMLIRIQLMDPTGSFLGEHLYNNVMSLHGIMMVAVAVASIAGGFGNYFLPLLIGARDVAFPRLNALSYWLVPPVAIMLILSLPFGGFDSGWTAYPPLSVNNASGQVLFNLAVITFGLSSIVGSLNFIVTIHKMRAPGMTWGRLPIFVWSIYAMSWIGLTFTQFFAAALMMVLTDRVIGTAFFDTANGGQPLLYQHVFWFYSHPAVYVFVLPGFGATLEVLVHFSRKPLFAYRWAVGAFLGILALSGVVWAHHMFVSGMPAELLAPFLVTTELISIPTGLVLLSALGTIFMGRIWLRVPMLFALGMIFNFVIGGITGIFLADVPTDMALHDSYFVVAHFHYTIIGGEIFALFAAVYYWLPKMTGRMYNERLGQIHFLIMFVGFNATFLPMFKVGLDGMNRRVASYEPALLAGNQLVSVMAFILGSSFIFFVINMLLLARKSAPRAIANPWAARTLEWQVPSPPPLENFPVLPVVESHPYDYGRVAPQHASWPGAEPEAAR